MGNLGALDDGQSNATSTIAIVHVDVAGLELLSITAKVSTSTKALSSRISSENDDLDVGVQRSLVELCYEIISKFFSKCVAIGRSTDGDHRNAVWRDDALMSCGHNNNNMGLLGNRLDEMMIGFLPD